MRRQGAVHMSAFFKSKRGKVDGIGSPSVTMPMTQDISCPYRFWRRRPSFHASDAAPPESQEYYTACWNWSKSRLVFSRIVWLHSTIQEHSPAPGKNQLQRRPWSLYNESIREHENHKISKILRKPIHNRENTTNFQKVKVCGIFPCIIYTR